MEGQKYLFDVLKKRTPEQSRLVDIIEELLGVSSDAAYRRISGKTELSFSELQKICTKFNLSMDDVLNYKSNQSALFQYSPINPSDTKAYFAYTTRLLNVLTALKSASEKEIIYVAQDIPFYHIMGYSDLCLFKLYAWNETLNRAPALYSEFCNSVDKEAIVDIYGKLRNSFLSIPSKEIWSGQTIDPMLRLIEHYYEVGAFENKDTVFLLLDQLDNMLDETKKWAEDGYKGNERTPYELYLCPVDFENNFMITKKEGISLCTIKLYTINTIITDNETLCKEVAKYIDDLFFKSIQISKSSVKERFRCFQSLKNKIEVLTDKIKHDVAK